MHPAAAVPSEGAADWPDGDGGGVAGRDIHGERPSYRLARSTMPRMGLVLLIPLVQLLLVLQMQMLWVLLLPLMVLEVLFLLQLLLGRVRRLLLWRSVLGGVPWLLLLRWVPWLLLGRVHRLLLQRLLDLVLGQRKRWR